MKICPACLLEFMPEKNTCPDCDVALVEREDYAVTLDWPHCANCENLITGKENKCPECGHKFHLIPILPKLTSLIIAIAVFYLVSMALNASGMNVKALAVIAMIAACATWFMLSRRINQRLIQTEVPWSFIDSELRNSLRDDLRRQQK